MSSRGGHRPLLVGGIANKRSLVNRSVYIIVPGNRRAMLLLIVLSGLIISLCMGLRQSLGLFMRPMTPDLGISAATFGFTIALQNIVWGASKAVARAPRRRYRPRPVPIATA